MIKQISELFLLSKGGIEVEELTTKAKIMDEKAMQRALIRISHEIIEKNKGVENLALIGIKTRGVPLAHKIAKNIEKIEGVLPKVGILDITLYRDDLSQLNKQPIINNTNIDIDISNKILVLVDDVLYTGRTVRSALNAITDIGRPQKIELAVLIDRGHRELPIRPDYIGKNVPTSRDEIVRVKIKEIDEEEEVIISVKS